MNPNIHRFDREAAVWDANPQRAALAQAIVRCVEAQLDEDASPRMLDYGCGTGLCSLPLAARCQSVLGVDVAPGMLAKLEEKAAALGLTNLRTLQHNLAECPLEGRVFDLIVCAMALHHVRDVALVLQRFRPLLAEGGVLTLADLDAEDGSFHADLTGVEHHGFPRNQILNSLWEAGFRQVDIATAHTIEKPSLCGEPRRYPVFFMAARVRPRGAVHRAKE